jgi:hypothetical protein
VQRPISNTGHSVSRSTGTALNFLYGQQEILWTYLGLLQEWRKKEHRKKRKNKQTRWGRVEELINHELGDTKVSSNAALWQPANWEESQPASQSGAARPVRHFTITDCCYVMSVDTSDRIVQLVSRWADFHEISHWEIRGLGWGCQTLLRGKT